MPSVPGLKFTFDTVAPLYARMRPGYPEDLYRHIFAYHPLNAASRAVEVGIGAGQATLPILKTGCHVTAVEFGSHFVEMCREKFKDFPGF